MAPSQTADQLHTGTTVQKHDQSPKLPDGIRQFKDQLGNMLFTGRLQNPNRPIQAEEEPSRETIPGPSSGIPISGVQDNQMMFERANSHQPEIVQSNQPGEHLTAMNMAERRLSRRQRNRPVDL